MAKYKDMKNITLGLRSEGYGGLLMEVKQVIKNAGIDESIYIMMKDDIIKGNFSVMYLDDRIVGDNKKRIVAQKRMNQIRSGCFAELRSGRTIEDILKYK